MWPTLFQIGSLTVYSYMFLHVLGLFLGLATYLSLMRASWPEAQKKKASSSMLWGLAALGAVFGLLAGIGFFIAWWTKRDHRLLLHLWVGCLVIFVGNMLAGLSWAIYTPGGMDFLSWRLLFSGGRIWAAGFFGQLICLAILAWVFRLADRLDPARLMDAAVPAGLIGIGVGKLGCFAAGCCGGTPCKMFFCISFPPHTSTTREQVTTGLLSSSEAWSLPVHPLQLYAFVSYLALGLIGMHLFRLRPAVPGRLASAWLALGLGLYLLLLVFNPDPIESLWRTFGWPSLAMGGLALIFAVQTAFAKNREGLE